MRANKLLVAAALLASSTTALADQDILSTYQQALQSDPVYQQAIANRNAVEEQLPQAKANVRPQITASGSAKEFRDSIDYDKDGSFDDTFAQFQFGAQLSQTLYDWSNYRQVDQAQAVVDQAKANFTAAQQSLIVRVAERYFGVLDAQVALQAAQAQLKAIKRQLEQARQRFQVGVIARTDVEQAKARYDLSQASLLQAQDNVDSAREQLRQLIGESPEPLFSVRDGINFTLPKPADETAWRKRAEDQNPSLLAARYGAQAQMTGVEVARGGHYPTVDAVASYGYTDAGGGSSAIRGGFNSSQAAIGVEVNVPIYLGGGTDSRIREAQYRYTESRERLEEVRRSVSRDASDAYRGVKTALERVRALDQSRQSTQSALEAVQAGYDVGTRTIVDVLNAQRDLFDATRDFQQERHAYLLNTLKLEQAAGTLTLDDLQTVNQLLVDQPPQPATLPKESSR